jgi:hypothetical protein
MEIGARKESEVATRKLLPEDIKTIAATLEFFNAEMPPYPIIAEQLTRHTIYNWLALNLDRESRIGGRSAMDDLNVWVALAVTYIHTSGPVQFINALRYVDLQLWEGKFNTKEFAEFLDEWNRDDVENERRLAIKEKRG